MTTPVVDHHAAIRVKDQVVIDAGKRKIAVQFDSVIVRSRARRQDLDDDDRVWDLERAEVGGGGGQTMSASGSNAVCAATRTVIPSGKTPHGRPAPRAPSLRVICAESLVSAWAARSGAIMTGLPSRSSQRPLRPSAQARNASTSISFQAGLDMRNLTIAGTC
jgi:hypothetical protein